MEAAAYGAMYGFMSIFMAVYYVVALGIAVVSYVALWKIFVKAGEPGWKCLIPFYGGYVMYKLFWKPVFFWLMLIFEVVACILLVWGTVAFGMAFYHAEAASAVLVALACVLYLAFLAMAIVWTVKLCLGMSRSFGYGGGFAAGLFFVPLVFQLILAFGKDTYKGNSYVKQAAPAQEPWNRPPVIDAEPVQEEKTEE